ncbi:hypothetical protein [Hymenobacter actinosclerus]|uniref:Uncharacterized protein n=1 Tax=Hymenobacter actinosclerus TaxID=82805 RepID=A0A1I0J1E6_9BACT|nr:hypothetical protein [Hymenobacter actinosclerus]SEU03485.1 hypothetical protein SAMN04487998_3595 [Hymenobacter actinosclerus]
MKVLVFPALLAIAIITGPPKPGTNPTSVPQANASLTVANAAPEKTTQLPANDAATSTKDAVGQLPRQAAATK